MTPIATSPLSSARLLASLTDAAARQALALRAHAAGRRLTFGAGPDVRLIDVCGGDHGCGATIEHDADGPCCEGAEIVPVTVLRPLVAMGVLQPPVLGTRADLERLGLVGAGEAA